MFVFDDKRYFLDATKELSFLIQSIGLSLLVQVFEIIHIQFRVIIVICLVFVDFYNFVGLSLSLSVYVYVCMCV